jgi:Secretion system C-terminal sorting domain
MKRTLPCTTISYPVSDRRILERRNSARIVFRGMNFCEKRFFSTFGKLFFLALLFSVLGKTTFSQGCPASGTSSISTNPNTYYPGSTASLSVGATSITLGVAGSGTNFGTTPIAVGDILLIIQMQGAQIISTNTSTYGSNTSGLASGFTTTNLVAGNMEFVVANSAVPVAGGALTLAAGTTYAYTNSAYGANGQYTYQVIRVGTAYNITLAANLTAPVWNGSTGGVMVINAVNQLNFNSKTISGKGVGFRGAGGRSLGGVGAAPGYSKTDYRTMSTAAVNGGKGEGIAGTPRYMNNNGVLLDNTLEGYPNGSYARGAPGTAGGGGTDDDPAGNTENSGGGGGSNGGAGGQGGWGWFAAGNTGGKGGATFSAYASPGRLILGGGGGAGTSNNGTPDGSGFASSGAGGGGLVIINATAITGTGTIDVSGSDATSTVINDGTGGAGAGGSVLIYANSGNSGLTVFANGGAGGTNTPLPASQHGPGGGGGGGVIFSNSALNAASSANGGAAGLSRGVIVNSPPDSSFGAVGGSAGILTQTFPSSQLPPNMTKCQVSVLAANLLEFNASYVSNNNVLVTWSTASQVNAGYYIVERSLDASNYTSVGQQMADQTTDEVHNYTLNDYLVGINASVIYYRLKMVGGDGTVSYSLIVPVRLNNSGSDTKISVYPNPATDYAVLNLFSGDANTATMRLIDNSGRQIMTKSFTINNGNNTLLIDHLGSLPKGVYFIQVFSGNSQYNEKLVKN